MAVLRRVPVVWSTGAGGPGVSVFYSTSAVDATADLQTFFGAIKSRFPTSITWSCAASGDEIESTTGALTGAWTGGTAWSDNGSAGAVTYAAGVGAVVRWDTGGLFNSRRLKGRTFLTGIETVNYDSAGTIGSSCLTNFTTAAATLAATGKLQIWHRPTPGGSNGGNSVVTGSAVPDRVAWLRTRRS